LHKHVQSGDQLADIFPKASDRNRVNTMGMIVSRHGNLFPGIYGLIMFIHISVTKAVRG